MKTCTTYSRTVNIYYHYSDQCLQKIDKVPLNPLAFLDVFHFKQPVSRKNVTKIFQEEYAFNMK